MAQQPPDPRAAPGPSPRDEGTGTRATGGFQEGRPPRPAQAQVPLAGYTTLRLGGPARRFAEAADDAELVAQVWAADERGEPLLVLGGGSNLVVADEGFPGTVVHVATRGIRHEPDGDRVLLTVAAGEDWDTVVAGTVADGLAGLECLSGIPGLAGRDPDPERGRLRPGGGPDAGGGPRLRPGTGRGGGPDRRRVRVRLPDQRLQAVAALLGGRGPRRDRPLRGARRDLPAGAFGAVRAGALRRTGARARGRRGRPCAAGRGQVRGAGTAPGQGHGAGCRRPGHA